MERFTKAIVIPPGSNFSEGITTSSLLGRPDIDKAREQHRAYCKALRLCGLELFEFPPDPAFPDSTFVEDTAIVAGSMAIITRPGNPGRLGEEERMEKVLKEWHKVTRILPPGYADGGDVLQVRSHFFIGLSDRTNREGAGQLRSILSGQGYTTSIVKVGNMLHLKSGVSYAGNDTLIIREEVAELKQFRNYRRISVTPRESYAANCIFVNGHLLLPEGFPDTRDKLLAEGYTVIGLDMSEFRKMDGGISCLSLRF